MTAELDYGDVAPAQAVMLELLPSVSDRNLVMQQLLDSAAFAESIAPNAWAVTLFANGFRLNVGQVEALVFRDGQLRVNLVGTAGIPPCDGPYCLPAHYNSLPQPLCAFVGHVTDYRVMAQSFRANHEKFLRLAALSPSGNPRKGTAFRKSHNEGLMRFARQVVSG